MERESNQMQALCRSGCGFYGSPATDGLCSLCYKEALKKKQQLPTGTPASLSSLRPERESSTAAAAAAAASIAHVLPAAASSSPAHSHSAAEPTVHQPAAPATAVDESAAAAAAASQEEAAAAAAAESATAASSDADDTGSSDDRDSDKDSKKKKNRCAMCRKKVGLTGFECRCGGLFCAVHRYSDKHECKFDYRLMGAAEIRRNNPVVVGEKIQKI